MGPADLLQKQLKGREEMKNILLQADEVVVFDLETTGFSVEKHAEIIEVGAVCLNLETGKAIRGFHRFIKPQNGIIPKRIQTLTGITPAMIQGEAYLEDVMPEFYQFIGDCPVVAHNARFDWFRFVQPYMMRVGRIVTNEVICTLELSKLLHSTMERHSLAELCAYYGHPIAGHHNAYTDAKYTASLCMKMRNEMLRSGFECANSVQVNILPSEVGFANMREMKVKRICPYRYKDKRLGTAIFCTTSFGTLYYNTSRRCWGFQNMTVPKNVDITDVVNEILRQQGVSQQEFVDKFIA